MDQSGLNRNNDVFTDVTILNSCDSIPSPLIRSPWEGQGPSVWYTIAIYIDKMLIGNNLHSGMLFDKLVFP